MTTSDCIQDALITEWASYWETIMTAYWSSSMTSLGSTPMNEEAT